MKPQRPGKSDLHENRLSIADVTSSLNIVFKVSIRPTGFLWFKPKKMNSNAFFAMKSSFKFPALAMPNEVDHVMKDW